MVCEPVFEIIYQMALQTNTHEHIALHGCTNSFHQITVETSWSKNPEASRPQHCYRAAFRPCLGTPPWLLLTPELNVSHVNHGSLHSCVPSFLVNTRLANCSLSSVKRKLLHISVHTSVLSLPPSHPSSFTQSGRGAGLWWLPKASGLLVPISAPPDWQAPFEHFLWLNNPPHD